MSNPCGDGNIPDLTMSMSIFWCDLVLQFYEMLPWKKLGGKDIELFLLFFYDSKIKKIKYIKCDLVFKIN
jgi:hypothetical protein